MPQVGFLPRQSALIAGVVAPGAVLRFYQSGTSTPQAAYTDAALSNPVTSLTADAAGVFAKWYLNPNASADYRYTLETAAGSVYWSEDNISRLIGTQADIGAALFPRTSAEESAGVTPTNYAYRPGYVERYGSNVTPGITDMSSALAAAISQAAQGGEPVRAETVLHIASSTTITTAVDFNPRKQVFSATSIVLFAEGSVPCVYPDWWGSASGAINKAVTATTGKFIPVYLNAGRTYQFSTGLALANDGDSIIGPRAFNATSGGVFDGAVLEYTGTSGTAILCGIAPGSNANFMEGLELCGFTLKLTENTDIGIRLWHVSGLSHVHDITIRGSSDNDTSDNIGLQIEGCVDLDVERVLIFGQGALGSGLTLLENGVKIMNGFSGSNTTTTRLRQVYISQCRFGANVADDSFVSFDHCVFESCHNAGLLMLNARIVLHDPWFEDNGASGNAPIRLQGAASSLVMEGGLVNVGTAQYFISCEANNTVTLLGNTRFATSHVSPRIFSLGGTQPTITIVGQNTYATSTTDSDTAVTKLIKINDGVVKLSSFTVAGVPAQVAGGLIYVSNETGGATIAFSDGTNWRRVQDRVVVS